MTMVIGIIVAITAMDGAAQSPDSNAGVNRPVSAQEVDRLRQAIYDETHSNVEGIFGLHRESGDLNNKVNFYRVGLRANVKLDSRRWLYASAVHTPYSLSNGLVKASGTNVTLGLRAPFLENVKTLAEVGATRFSNGGKTINALGSIGLASASSALTLTASRSNVEETLLSATGVRPVAGPLTGQTVGRVMDNRIVVDGSQRVLPRLDVFGNGGFGNRRGLNVDSNFFLLGGGGAGFNLISAPPEETVSLLRGSYEANYIGFADDRSGFAGARVGGYFSPPNFFAHVVRGEMRGRPVAELEYQVSGFVGSQYYTGSPRRQAAGFAATAAVRVSDRYSVPVTVARDNFGPFTQNLFLTKLVVRF